MTVGKDPTHRVQVAGDIDGLVMRPTSDTGGFRPRPDLPDLVRYPLARTLQNHVGAVAAVRFSTAGTRLASGSASGAILVHDVETGTCVHAFKGHDQASLDFP
jgi:WD40 repeat protein